MLRRLCMGLPQLYSELTDVLITEKNRRLKKGAEDC